MTTGIQKNTVVKSNRFSTNGILEDMETKYFEGAEWAKIFEHNNHAGTVLFSSVSEALHSETPDKYSRLYLLDSFKNVNNKYEFLLQYPDNFTDKYNRWIQNLNPCNEYITPTSSGTPADGYTAVHVDWTGNHWGGLTRQNSSTTEITSYCYLSGSTGHNNWWYAIASKQAFNGGIPGPSVVVTARTQLWVRIDNLPEENKFQISKNTMIANDFYEI